MRIILYREGVARRNISGLTGSLSTEFLYPTPICHYPLIISRTGCASFSRPRGWLPGLGFLPALRTVLLQLGDSQQGVIVGEFPEIVLDEDRHGNLVKDPRGGVLGIPGGDQGENGCDTKVWP